MDLNGLEAAEQRSENQICTTSPELACLVNCGLTNQPLFSQKRCQMAAHFRPGYEATGLESDTLRQKKLKAAKNRLAAEIIDMFTIIS